MAKEVIDRYSPPPAGALPKVILPEMRKFDLVNGIPVYTVQMGSEKIVEFQAVFPAGKSFEPKPAIAGFTSHMLTEGTKDWTGLELARKIDEFGAFLNVETGNESASIVLTSLTKRLPDVLPLVQQVVVSPTFPEEDFEKLKMRTIQRLEVDEKKSRYVARKEFNRLMFGNKHPYGRHMEKEEIEDLGVEQLVEYHRTNYSPNGSFILAVGRFDEEELVDQLNEQFDSFKGDHDGAGHTKSQASLPAEPAVTGFHYFEREDSTQATIRLGHPGFDRMHPDYYGMQVVTAILGGYFGSRLMKNIREEKGYTYGIGAAWISLKYGGYFLIQTDVGNEYIRPTLEEIRKEVDLLLKAGVGKDELNLVKNYMLGRLISSRETPSQISDIYSAAIINDIPLDELNAKFEAIKGITPEDVARLATTHIHPDQFIEVVCGKLDDV